MKIAILIVAAGESKRLGRPKQLVSYKGKTLLYHTIRECLETEVKDVYLVLGANKEEIETQIVISDCTVVYNENWKKGMGESIASGVKKIVEKEDYDGIIITVGDQPFLSSKILNRLIEKAKKEKKPIIISKYKEGAGPPSFFDKEYFSELMELSTDEGAKGVIKKYKEEVLFISFEQGDIDIDTPEDLRFI